MNKPRPTRKPIFLWQGLLILLPVVALVIAGLAFLLRDQLLVEQEARQRAGERVRQFTDDLDQRVASVLTDFEIFGANMNTSRASGSNSWPDSLQADSWAKAKIRFQQRFATWQAQEPDLEAKRLLPIHCGFNEAGQLDSPPDYPLNPAPPDWLRQMSPEQYRAWQAAERRPPGPRDSSYQRSLELNTDAEARANAQFALLVLPVDRSADFSPLPRNPSSSPARTETNSVPRSPAGAVQQFLDFANRQCWLRDDRGVSHPILAESGLPLANLALAQALKHAEESGSNLGANVDRSTPLLAGSTLESELKEPLFNELSVQVRKAPSIFIPHFLSQAERLAQSGSPTVKQAVGNLRGIWETEEQIRQLAHCLQMKINLAGIRSTNLWLDSPHGRWFVVINARQAVTFQNGTGLIPTNQETAARFLPTAARFFPKQLVERAFCEALNNSISNLPPYFALGVELDGESLSLSKRSADFSPLPGKPFSVTGAQPTPQRSREKPPVLAQAGGILNLGIWHLLREPHAGEPIHTNVEKGGMVLIRPKSGASDPIQTEPDIDSFPSHPAFTLRLLLADPALLYARHRERTVWIALFLAASTAVALVGLIAAWRAFYRQLRLNEMKTNFVSSVSHELRAPIASVRLMAEGLESGRVQGEEKRTEYFRFIVQECRRLSALIENVLDFSRIEQGRKQYEFEPTDLAALVRQTVNLMEPAAAERQIRLLLELEESQISNLKFEINLDGRALQQALVNLIDNAIKYSSPGQTVTIGLDTGEPLAASSLFKSQIINHKSQIPTQVRLWVEDHGPGIPPQDHARIFERFFRRGSELRRETQGVGLGLAIVKHIVEAHGGRVTVRSAPGQGSRFTIELSMNNQGTN